MSYKIGNIEINNILSLAPMAGVTNIAYRKMCKKFGAGVVTSEMISDKGIFYGDKKTKELALIDVDEHPVGIQIFGGDIDTLVYAAKWVDTETNADFIDINMGCPVPKVLKSRAGSDYLKDVKRIYQTVKEVVANVKKPVTVKIRIGYDHNSINALEVCKAIIKAGASAIAIHGRTKSDLYSGEVNYQIIKEIKEKFPDFVIIANGNIDSPQKAKEILEYTKCDGLMIGRASYGNPYIFTQINHYLQTNELLPDLKKSDKIKILLDYAKDLIAYKGELVAIRELRGQVGWFIKGYENSAKIRNRLTSITTFAELESIVKPLLNVQE